MSRSDDLLDGGSEQIGIGASGNVTRSDPLVSGPADLGEAFHQAAQRFCDAILRVGPTPRCGGPRYAAHSCAHSRAGRDGPLADSCKHAFLPGPYIRDQDTPLAVQECS